MHCGKCGNDNREGRRFCAECGATLAVKCAQCGASNEPNEKFCGECGTALFAIPRPPTPEAKAAQTLRLATEDTIGQLPDGERKTVTKPKYSASFLRFLVNY
jgi:hypothetical protein